MTESEKWLTMKEACAHLKVSHMSIRRWMKAGRLTCFKLGSGLRFRREDLDQLTTKSATGPEAGTEEALNSVCPVCSHHELIPGRVQSTGRLYFKAAKNKFFTFLESTIPTEAMMCSACGYLLLFADTDKLEKLR